MYSKTLKKLSIMLLATILLMAVPQSLSINFQEVSTYEEKSLILDVFTQKTPFNGRGLNQSSDPFAPYEVVKLYGNLTCNGHPLVKVPITFNIAGPPNELYNYTFEVTRETNESGIASLDFSFPQPNDTEIIGIWTVKALVEYKGRSACDILTFRVDWIIRILSVKPVNSTGDYQRVFGIGGEMGIEVTLRNIARNFKNTTLFVGFHDELNVYFGNETENFGIEPNNRTVKIYFKLPIPKWAVLGSAVLYACALTPNKTAYCPQMSSAFYISQFKPPLTINIHDLSIVNLELTRDRVAKDEKVKISVTIRNEGTETENATVNLYCNLTLIGKLEVNNLKPYTVRKLSLELDTADLDPGKYTILAEIPPLPVEAETEDNLMTKEFTIYIPYHDLAIINVSSPVSEALIGDIIPIEVALKNNGTEVESFPVELYANSIQIGKINISNLMPTKTLKKTFNWNTEGFDEGRYVIKALIPPIPEEENVKNNYFIDGIVHLRFPAQPFHDVAIESVSVDKPEATIGGIITITVHVKNLGNFTEKFRVEAYANQTSIGNQTLKNVTPLKEEIINFTWNTTNFKEGKYYIKVVIPPLPAEKNTENNVYEYREITLLPPTPSAWNLFIILLIIILLLLLLLTIFALRKKKRKAKRGHLAALIKLSLMRPVGFESGITAVGDIPASPHFYF